MNRTAAWGALSAPLDVLIVGGGATGLGIAVDAVTRGLTVALVEAGDFAQATSSRSTKLAHGGVRYLATGQITLVREALQERAVMLRNAPHLVRPLPTIVPAQHWWELPYYGAGLMTYDLLSGSSSMGPTRLLSRKAVAQCIQGINPQRVQGGVLYHDAQFNDARFAAMLARTAADHGAAVLNYARCLELLYDDASPRQVIGAQIRDEETLRTVEVRARLVVNAAGIFSDELRAQDEPLRPPLLRISRGTHIVIDRRFLNGDSALMVPKTEDGRVIFAIPWQGVVVVGTTDLPARESVLEPGFEPDEISYLLEHIRPYLAMPLGEDDILSVFSGLRPLVQSTETTKTRTSRLSREHHIDRSPSGLLNIAGGKWTTYRRMAEDLLNFALQGSVLAAKPCVTRDLALHGAGVPRKGGDPFLTEYGADAAAIQSLMTQEPKLAERLDPDLPYTAAMVVYAVREEFARTLEDVLSRRTRALLINARAAMRAAPAAAAWMQRELGESPEWTSGQVAAFRDLARHCYLPERAARAAATV